MTSSSGSSLGAGRNRCSHPSLGAINQQFEGNHSQITLDIYMTM